MDSTIEKNDMKCNLCEKEIIGYDLKFNHLKIDDSHEIDVCRDCTDKFMKWQGSIIADLFPTRTLKRRFDKNK